MSGAQQQTVTRIRLQPAPYATPLADAAAVLAIAACALLLHRDGLFGGPAFYELDTRLFYFPLADWVGQQLHAGSFPLWLPAIFTGYPIYADGELGLLYLPQVALLWALPAPLALVWLRALHAFLAGLFAYLLFRSQRLGVLAALGGALVFAFGSFLSAQMHHENVVRSSVWLPAVLACAERASGTCSRRRQVAWTALGALAMAQSALGLHVQPVLMLALALGGFVLFKAMTRRPFAIGPIASGAGMVIGGLAVAAAQWLPLGEWALVSFRRGGVDYEFASAFALAPQNLATLIFPFFFRLPDDVTWWSLWQQWEITLYVGIPTLALVIVGILFAHRVEVVYYALLGGLALLIGMAAYAPLVNVHLLLWSVPGFSFLRAPGRFSYLVVFACAGLAAFGIQALAARRRTRLLVALAGGVPSVSALAALLALLPAWRTWLASDPARASDFAHSTYLAARAQYPIDPDLVVQGMLSSLDLANPKTAWSLILLMLTALGFVAYVALGRQRVALAQAVFVGLIGIDLLVFAYDFHPRAPLASLAPPLPAGVSAGQRVLLLDALDLPDLAPNQLLSEGVQTTDGYSSLPSQRHVELQAITSARPDLFDLWSAERVLEPADAADAHQVDGVRFRAQHPLASGFGGASPASFRLPATDVSQIRLIGTLSYAYNVPQGQTVATLSVGSASVPIRAGIELSERAFDRPSLRGSLQHQKAPVALDFDEATPEGEAYVAHLYEVRVPVNASGGTLSIRADDPKVLVEIHGIGLVAPDGGVRSLDLGDRQGLERVADHVFADTDALPRAFVLPRDQAFSPARHTGLTSTQLVASPDVDLHRQVLIENDPGAPSEPDGQAVAQAAERIEDPGPNAVRVTARADVPSYLVLDDFYHRGWTARVDGQPSPVFIANALFRAVALEPGTHTVDFEFRPLSHIDGAIISALALAIDVLAVIWGTLGRAWDGSKARTR